jgi:L-ascorbate metabolism protein UlaG (beta-lactamase superfamily)
MTTIRRLTDSCLLITSDDGVTLTDPGFFTFESGEVDLASIGQVDRVLITHEHRDHVNPGFVKWLRDRSPDVVVYANTAVAGLLAEHDIPAVTDDLPGYVTAEGALHEPLPNGSTVPNRSYTIGNVVTHPGDSYSLTKTAPVLALPLLAPWGSTTQSVAFAKRLGPRQVIPIHDFFMSPLGQEFLYGIAGGVLANAGIEFVPLKWNESYSV